ncbi:MAG: amidohydrolase family protein [Candidatus Nanopelagicales bacterium]
MQTVKLTDTWLVDDRADLFHGDVVLHPDGSWAPANGDEGVDEVINGSRLLVTRTLQNWHTHLAMVLNRSMGEGLPLQRWLSEVIFPVEQLLNVDLVRVGTTAAAAELIRTGTSFACDMYYFPDVVADVLVAAGLRGLACGPVTDFGTPSYPGGARESLAQLDRLLAEGTAAPDRVRFGIGMHSVYTCSEATLRAGARLADARDGQIHIHVSETRKEVADCLQQTGRTPPRFLADVGLLRPGTVAAHCCWTEGDDAQVLAEAGVIATHTPVSNMKLATGRTMSVPTLVGAGVDVRLGTDGPASNNSLDLRSEAKVASLVQRHDHAEATLLDPRQTWLLATKGSQDWVTWDLDDVRMRPMGPDGARLLSNLVYSNAQCVDMWVAGAPVRRQGVTLTLDEADVRDRLEHAVQRYYHGMRG